MTSQLTGRCMMRLANLDRISISKAKARLYHHTTTASFGSNGDKMAPSTTHRATLNVTHNATVSKGHSIPSHQSLDYPHIGGFTISPSDNLVQQLQVRLSKMSVSPLPSGLYLANQSNIQYKLPPQLGNELTERIIVDPAASNAVRECPTMIQRNQIEDPRSWYNNTIDAPPTIQDRPAKQARIRNILIIRRKKMKKHKLNKLRKRMRFLKKIILQRRERKKRKAWDAHLETFKFRGLTDEIIEKHLERRQRKLTYMTNFLRSEAGLQKQVVKKKREKKPLPGPLIPTPILPPGAMRR